MTDGAKRNTFQIRPNEVGRAANSPRSSIQAAVLAISKPDAAALKLEMPVGRPLLI
jgi:hypothetical protein